MLQNPCRVCQVPVETLVCSYSNTDGFIITMLQSEAGSCHDHHEICHNESLVKADFLTLIIMDLDIIVSI